MREIILKDPHLETPMINILIARHAETTNNKDRIAQGDSQGTITPEGHAMLAKLAERLSDEPIDLVLSSTMHRCRESTQAILGTRNIPLEHLDTLREKSNGDWAGKHRDKLNWTSLEGDFENRKPPNGESLADVKARAQQALKQIKKHEGKTLLVVTHGAFIKILIGHLLGMALTDSILKLQIDNCSLSRITFEAEACKIITLNDTNHLSTTRTTQKL